MTVNAPKSRKPKLPKEKTAVALALVSGMSNADVAARCNLSADTITRWKKDPDFIALMDSLAHEARDQAVRQLQQWTTEASRMLYEIAKNPKTPSNTRVQAINTMLKYGGIETRSTTVISGPDGGPIEIASAAKVAMEQALAEVAGEDLGIPDGIIDPS